MAVLKVLDVLLRGNTEMMEKDFKKGESILKSFRAKFASIASAGIPFLAVASLTAGINVARGELDELSKRSVKLQIDVGELAALERTATLAGLSIEDIAAAQKFLSLNIGKANMGAKAQKKIFDSLGIETSTFSKLATTEQFVTISKGLETIQDKADKTRIAIGLFGKQGINLLPLLSNVEELKSSFAETSRLGGIFSSSDLSLVEEFNDRFDDLKFTFGNLVKRMTIDLAPSLTDITKDLIEMIKPGTAIHGIFSAITDVVNIALVPLRLLSSTFSAISNFLGTTTGKLVGYIAATAVIIKLSQQLLVVLKTTRAVLASTFAIKAATAQLDLKTGALKLGKAVAAFAAVVASVKALEADIQGVFKDTGKAANDMERFAKAAQISESFINQTSVKAGSQEDFEVRYGVRIQAPMNQLIDATKEGNEILGAIKETLQQGSGIVNQFDIGEDFE